MNLFYRISLLSCVISSAFGLNCFSCFNGGADCNATTCVPRGCENKSTCEGSCTLTVVTTPVKTRTVTAMCIPQFRVPNVYNEDNSAEKCKQNADPLPLEGEENSTSITCMCQLDYCNSYIILKKQEIEDDITEGPEKSNSTIYVVCAVIGAIVLLIVIIVISRHVVAQRRKMREEEEKHAMAKAGQNRFSADSSSLLDGGWDDTAKYSSSMGSHYSRGSKGNALNQNDQHLPIQLDKVIGRGRFADVYKAKWLRESQETKVISVKVFRLPNYGAWRQEGEILSEKWMKHENIIEYYASEKHSSRGRLQFWLITDYYAKGNLQEFLRNNSLKWNEFCDMSASIAKGLAYLHGEHDLTGKEKLPVAHRDVKSCNILVKDDGVTCVLADFGLSLKLDPSLNHDELANAGQVGTSRYMAPELLERLVNLADIEMFKRVDMYAFALVMWELATRCDIFEGMLRPYQPPFGDRIADHPTKEQILLLVCRSKQRPEIRPEWRNHSGLAKYVETMTECWDSEPEARLTASCVYERILEIRNEENITEIPLSPKEAEALQKEALVDNKVNEMTELISNVA